MRVCRLLMVAAAFPLSACQLPPIGDMTPERSCPRDAHVGETDIFVVTARGFRCRSMVAEFGPYRELSGLNFGRSSGVSQFPHGFSPTTLVDAAAWENDLDLRVRLDGAPVVYIHGFNNSEDEATRRARAIGALLMDSRPVVAITWPSYAMNTAVGWDEANNEWAREGLSTRLAWIVQRYRGTTLIAHSMGNRILVDFLVNHPEVIGNIGQIIAAAPDVDEDEFMRHMQMGRSFGPPVTIYTSRKDQALAMSWMWHGMRRAGDLSATAHNRTVMIRYLDLDSSVKVVDLTLVKGDPYGHSDFIQSIPGAADLCRVLNHLPVTRPALRDKQLPYFELAQTDNQNDACDGRAARAARIDKGEERSRGG